jgi:hypothetical protein
MGCCSWLDGMGSSFWAHVDADDARETAWSYARISEGTVADLTDAANAVNLHCRAL